MKMKGITTVIPWNNHGSQFKRKNWVVPQFEFGGFQDFTGYV